MHSPHNPPSGERPIVENATLYVVPTPIGNLADITARALTVLREVDIIACEDTRTTARLLTRHSVDTLTTSFHAHNEHKKTSSLIQRLLDGQSIALVSDAGSPGISDPGYLLVRSAVKSGVNVVALPGATAFVPALTASGLPSDRFIFEGFLPPKKGRQKRLISLSEEDRTMVFYEGPHRLLKFLGQLEEHFGSDRYVVVAREISKRYEEYHRGSIRHVFSSLESLGKIRGEIVVVVAGKSHDTSDLVA